MSVPLSVRSGGLLSAGAAASDDFEVEETGKQINVQVARLQDVTVRHNHRTHRAAMHSTGRLRCWPTAAASLLASHLIVCRVTVVLPFSVFQLEPATALGPSSLSPSPPQSPQSASSPTAAADPDRVLRYFHSPHSYACSSIDAPSAIPSGGEHVACASCNPHGLKHSRPTSKLSVFKSNYISTTKYTAWNFIPRNLVRLRHTHKQANNKWRRQRRRRVDEALQARCRFRSRCPEALAAALA